MDSFDNEHSYGGASRPPRQETQEEKPLLSDMTYASGRRTPNSGRPDYYAQSAAQRSRAAEASAGRAQSARPARDSGTPRPGSDRRSAPVYTEISWDDLFRSSQPSQPAQPRPQPAPQPQTPPPTQPQPRSPGVSQPQSRPSSAYFGGFEQERGDMFNSPQTGTPASDTPLYRESRYIPLNENDTARPAAEQYSSPFRQQDRQASVRQPVSRPSAPRQSAPRQMTPLQSLRETAFRQASRNAPRQAPPRAGTPAPAKRASGGAVPPDNGGAHVNTTRRTRPRIHPAFYAAGFVLLALAIFLLARFAGKKSNTAPVNVRPSQGVGVSVTPVPEATPEAGAEAEATPSPTPSPSPSPTPSGPKAKKLGELIVPADWGPVVPERKKAVYDSFFDRSIMIGNSMVEGFFMWAGMEKSMDFKYATGATVSNAVGGMDLAKLTLNKSDYYTDIYLMFGLNEIGTDVNSFVQSYKRLVDFVREHQTKANIYIISVTPVTRQVDEDPNEVQSMDRIRTFNAALKEFCADQNCWYLDIYNLLLDKNGYLSGDYAYIGDGKHFEKSGYVAWANYMKTHYVDEGLLTE